MSRSRHKSPAYIYLCIIIVLIAGCAKKTDLNYQKKLNGGGTIIGNPEPYAPDPAPGHMISDEGQIIAVDFRDIIGSKASVDNKNYMLNEILSSLFYYILPSQNKNED